MPGVAFTTAALAILAPVAGPILGLALQASNVQDGMRIGIVATLLGTGVCMGGLAGLALLLRLDVGPNARTLLAILVGAPLGGAVGFFGASLVGLYFEGVGGRAGELLAAEYLQDLKLTYPEYYSRVEEYVERGTYGGLVFAQTLIGLAGGFLVGLSIRSMTSSPGSSR